MKSLCHFILVGLVMAGSLGFPAIKARGEVGIGLNQVAKMQWASAGQGIDLEPGTFVSATWHWHPWSLAGEVSVSEPNLNQVEGSLSLSRQGREHSVWLRRDLESFYGQRLFLQVGGGNLQERLVQSISGQQLAVNTNSSFWGWGGGFSWHGSRYLEVIVQLRQQWFIEPVFSADPLVVFAIGMQWNYSSVE